MGSVCWLAFLYQRMRIGLLPCACFHKVQCNVVSGVYMVVTTRMVELDFPKWVFGLWRTWLGLWLAVSFQEEERSSPALLFSFALWNKFFISLHNNLPSSNFTLYLIYLYFLLSLSLIFQLSKD
ncbi:hypothetical protein VNO77_11098 [Canavalia gladiata]|uniref:Uncharacterized protein n=1 Tax=Canavalia gladiata TaxID=3824 RepID=A0AAN9MBN1_CANGL